MDSTVASHPDPVRRSGLPSSPWLVGRAFLLGMALLIFVGYLAYCVFHFGLTRFEDADARRVKEREKILADRLGEDAKWLNGAPSWFAKEKGIVRVPIKEAMQMTATELAAIAPHAADPIAAASPAPATPSPTPAASPSSAP